MLRLGNICYSQIDSASYDALFHSAENATPFHSRSWMNMVASARKDLEPKVLVVYDNDREIAYLPYFTIVGRPAFWLFMPYGAYSGFIYSSLNKTEISDFLMQKRFARLFTQVVIFEDTIYKELSYLHEVPEKYSTWILPTNRSYSDVFSDFPSKTKNQIRKAFKADVLYKKIDTERELEECKALYSILVEKHRILNPYILKLFEHIYKISLQQSNIVFNIATQNDRVIAYSVFLTSRTHVFYWLNASDPAMAALNATNGLLAQMIQYCCEQPDVRMINFGAVPSGNEGLLQFKKNWGTIEIKYGYYNSYFKHIKDALYGFMGK